MTFQEQPIQEREKQQEEKAGPGHQAFAPSRGAWSGRQDKARGSAGHDACPSTDRGRPLRRSARSPRAGWSGARLRGPLRLLIGRVTILLASVSAS